MTLWLSNWSVSYTYYTYYTLYTVFDPVNLRTFHSYWANWYGYMREYGYKPRMRWNADLFCSSGDLCECVAALGSILCGTALCNLVSCNLLCSSCNMRIVRHSFKDGMLTCCELRESNSKPSQRLSSSLNSSWDTSVNSSTKDEARHPVLLHCCDFGLRAEISSSCHCVVCQLLPQLLHLSPQPQWVTLIQNKGRNNKTWTTLTWTRVSDADTEYDRKKDAIAMFGHHGPEWATVSHSAVRY